MIELKLNQQVAQNQQAALAALFVKSPETRKRIRKIISEELKDVAKRLREDVRYEMKEDPRQAYKAVRSALLKGIMGGKVSIASPWRAGAGHRFERPRKLDMNPWQRGGNRTKRSPETERMDSYVGRDRAFVLCFLNAGTAERKTRYGNRGSIKATNWFKNMAPKEMELAAENLANVIEEELAEAYAEIIRT